MRIIFMGTCDFSANFLRALVACEHQIVAVFTQMPKPKGRGMSTEISEVHALANESQMKVYTPKTLRSSEAEDLINSIQADVIVLVSYGFIIPKNILESKKYGCINVHPSSLPKYRGPSPMQYVIMNGETNTSVCVMKMDEGVDTGDILMQEDITIDFSTTVQDLKDISSSIGSRLLLETLENIDTIEPKKQSQENVSMTYKIKKEMGQINWNETAFQIDCKVRALQPQISVYFEHNNDRIKVIKSSFENVEHSHKIGTIMDNKDKIKVACGSGFLTILDLQKSGKRIMSAKEFLLGNKIEINEILP